jgi:hypothetical protein
LSAREDAGRGRLADAAHAGRHVALGDAVGGERIPGVVTMASWPIRSAKVAGRYLRASTT